MRAATAVLVLAACGGTVVTQPSTPAVTVDQEFTLAPGQTARVTDASWRVTFDRVTQDSRCTPDVTCVWEGDASARVTVAPGTASPSALELHTSAQGGEVERRIGELYLRLVRLEPLGRAGAPVRPQDYRATFRASRTPIVPASPQP